MQTCSRTETGPGYGKVGRIAVLLISAAVLVSQIAVMGMSEGSDAADSGTEGNIDWSISSGTLTLSKNPDQTEGTMNDYSGTHPAWNMSGSWDSVTQIVIQEGVTSIGQSAFEEDKSIVSVELPASLKRIEDSACVHMHDLSDINLENVEFIGHGAFYACKQLSSVVLSGAVEIGNYAFDLCEELETVDLTQADNLVRIGDGAFVKCQISTIHIPAKVSEIGTGVFSECMMESVTVDPASTSFAEQGGVLYSKDMTVLFLYPQLLPGDVFMVPGTVETIETSAFIECQNLKNIILSESLKTIKEGSFQRTNLVSLTIPASVEVIDGYTFNKCTKLTTVDMSAAAKITVIGEAMFRDCTSLTEIILPPNTSVIEDDVFKNCGSLTTITISDANTHLRTVDGVLYDAGIKTVITYPAGKTAESFTTPDTVTAVATRAFAYCDRLKEVSLPSVVTIGDGAFLWCSNLETVRFGDGLRTIGTGSFFGCTQLSSADLPDSLTTIGQTAFAGCDLRSVVIPVNVTEIQAQTFSQCWSLLSIALHPGITNIGNDQFGHDMFYDTDGTTELEATAESLAGYKYVGENQSHLVRQNNVTVTFEKNGGTGTMDPQTLMPAVKTTLRGNTFSREGFDFAGWNTQADGTGTAYTDGAAVSLSESITLYAQWNGQPAPPSPCKGGDILPIAAAAAAIIAILGIAAFLYIRRSR